MTFKMLVVRFLRRFFADDVQPFFPKALTMAGLPFPSAP